MPIYQATKEDGTPEWVFNDGIAKQRFPTYEAAQAASEVAMTTGDRPSAAQEWEQQLRLLIGGVRGNITQAQALSLLAQTNDIEQLITDTPDGEYLPGTTIRKEDAALRSAVFREFMAWVNQTSEGSPYSRLAILFKRF